MEYMHKLNIAHRDVKLDNILLDGKGQVKIVDFGVSKQITLGTKMREQCGTPAYIAPEILRDQGYYGFAVDIWSSGAQSLRLWRMARLAADANIAFHYHLNFLT